MPVSTPQPENLAAVLLEDRSHGRVIQPFGLVLRDSLLRRRPNQGRRRRRRLALRNMSTRRLGAHIREFFQSLP